jgi:hypothetical protein
MAQRKGNSALVKRCPRSARDVRERTAVWIQLWFTIAQPNRTMTPTQTDMLVKRSPGTFMLPLADLAGGWRRRDKLQNIHAVKMPRSNSGLPSKP